MEGSSKSSLARFWTRPSFTSDFGAILLLFRTSWSSFWGDLTDARALLGPPSKCKDPHWHEIGAKSWSESKVANRTTLFWSPLGLQKCKFHHQNECKRAPELPEKVIWNLSGKNTRLSLFSKQFRENVEGQKYEKAWEGCSKSSFADLWTRPSPRTNSETILIGKWSQFRL